MEEEGQVHTTRIAEQTGRDITTVRRKLDLMLILGLAEPLGYGWWRLVVEPDLDSIARELGTAGKGKRQRQQHRHERSVQRLVMDRMGRK